jgi:hypothetical protein
VEFNGFILLAVLWFLVNLLTSGRRKQAPPSRPSPTQRPPSEPRTIRVEVDASQQEGSRLERMLRDLQQTLEDAARTQDDYPPGFPPALPEAEVEKPGSWEAEPEVVSLENEVRREARLRVDRDDEAAEFETRRIQAAAARDHARTKADHVAFDQRIRQQPAEHTATRGYTAQQLRDAIVWREILGPPVSLRGEAGTRGSGEAGE